MENRRVITSKFLKSLIPIDPPKRYTNILEEAFGSFPEKRKKKAHARVNPRGANIPIELPKRKHVGHIQGGNAEVIMKNKALNFDV